MRGLSGKDVAFVKPYLDLLRHVLEHGAEKSDRTGTGTRSVFGWQMRFALGDGFPLLTTKKLHVRSIVHELLWFLRGETNIAYLKEHQVTVRKSLDLACGTGDFSIAITGGASFTTG